MLASMRGRVRRVAAVACLAGAATAALVVSTPASAGDSGACPGSLIESINATWLGKKYGELDVYYDAATGRNCAKMNHSGSAWGKRTWTGVQVTICAQKRPGERLPSDRGRHGRQCPGERQFPLLRRARVPDRFGPRSLHLRERHRLPPG